MIDVKLYSELQSRKEENLFRELKSDTNKVDFCSNDYLGFSKKKWNIENFSHGSTGSRLISGHSKLYEKVEQFISQFHGSEDSLIFNSGYTANLGFFSTIPQKGDTVIYDELCHASIRDGLKLGNARNYSFQHNSVIDLSKKIKNSTGNIFVVVESIYSMDGDTAPLKKISEICKQEKAHLIVDEAHSTGIFGEKGEGICQELEIKTFARIHTFGKALGIHGAAISCNKTTKEYLVNCCRPFIYTTALPPSSLQIILQSYNKILDTSERQKLFINIKTFKNNINFKDIIESNSPIQSIIIGGNEETRDIAKSLQESGFDIRAILHPTVSKGSERIRICIHSFNKEEDIKRLCKKLNNIL